ncbi:hypothetical protein DPR02_22640 [Burkholderia cepacia]|uniref:Uncharacterized protein n=1 Tax=Burkholderia cepacia TaxID=292 RepID=A0AAQ0FBD8_BURCE|nr:hypothetical protein DPR02_22640 [Burkholderia cepacia]
MHGLELLHDFHTQHGEVAPDTILMFDDETQRVCILANQSVKIVHRFAKQVFDTIDFLIDFRHAIQQRIHLLVEFVHFPGSPCAHAEVQQANSEIGCLEIWIERFHSRAQRELRRQLLLERIGRQR